MPVQASALPHARTEIAKSMNNTENKPPKGKIQSPNHHNQSPKEFTLSAIRFSGTAIRFLALQEVGTPKPVSLLYSWKTQPANAAISAVQSHSIRAAVHTYVSFG